MKGVDAIWTSNLAYSVVRDEALNSQWMCITCNSQINPYNIFISTTGMTEHHQKPTFIWYLSSEENQVFIY